MKSYSQSQQDLWAISHNPNPGFFVDIGCSIPEFQSNSKLLLENGWSGICVDVQERSKEWSVYDNVRFIQGDATKIDWTTLVQAGLIPQFVDYASVDVDIFTYESLKRLIEHGIKFKCATVEHDAYRFADTLRIPERTLMLTAGYELVKADVSHDGCPYEDWWALRP